MSALPPAATAGSTRAEPDLHNPATRAPSPADPNHLPHARRDREGDRMPDLRAILTRLDGIATAAELADRGLPGSSLRAAAGSTITRIRAGVYALPDCDPEVLAAARIGGRLAGAAAARHHGIWAPPARRLVVEVPPGRHVEQSVDARVLRPRRHHGRRYGVAPLPEALRQVLYTEPVPFAVAILDSALRRSPTTKLDLEFLCRGLPERRRSLLTLVDERAESGTESVVRVALRLAGIDAVPQVRVPLTDFDRLDLLVGDRLVIECDSREFHSTPEQLDRDNARDLLLIAMGFVVVRVRYRHAMHRLDDVIAAIRRLVDDGVHLDGTALVRSDTPLRSANDRRVG